MGLNEPHDLCVELCAVVGRRRRDRHPPLSPVYHRGLAPDSHRGHSCAGGYRVTGRVPFVSNCHDATWYTANARIGEAGPPRQETAPPALVRVFLPMAAGEIIDTWHVLGMRGTGSQDVAVIDVFVPEALTFPLTQGCAGAALSGRPLPLSHRRDPSDGVSVRGVGGGSVCHG